MELEQQAWRYGEGKASLARAARDAGVSIWAMMDYLRTHKIAAQYDLEDLEDDLRMLGSRLASR